MPQRSHCLNAGVKLVEGSQHLFVGFSLEKHVESCAASRNDPLRLKGGIRQPSCRYGDARSDPLWDVSKIGSHSSPGH
jgi:hypothetical protein